MEKEWIMNKIDDQRLRRIWHPAIIILIVLVTLAGCRGKTRPISYYTLSPIQSTVSDASQQPENDVSIGVGPISFPEYINKPRIAIRDSSTKILYSEFHRWAGFLEKTFLRVVAEDLSVILDTDLIGIYPWNGSFEPRYQVKLDVKQFDGQLNGQVTLNVVWQVVDNSESGPPIVRRSVITEPAGGQGPDDYTAMVSAQSRTLEQLSREIAGVISKE